MSTNGTNKVITEIKLLEGREECKVGPQRLGSNGTITIAVEG